VSPRFCGPNKYEVPRSKAQPHFSTRTPTRRASPNSHAAAGSASMQNPRRAQPPVKVTPPQPTAPVHLHHLLGSSSRSRASWDWDLGEHDELRAWGWGTVSWAPDRFPWRARRPRRRREMVLCVQSGHGSKHQDFRRNTIAQRCV